MSTTGKLQAISSRGFRLQWGVTPSPEPDADLLACKIIDGTGTIVAQESRPIRVRGAVVTKESEVAQRDALIAWAEEVTRHPVLPPVITEPEPAGAVGTAPAEENTSHGEEISGPIPTLDDVEVQADDPV